MNWQRKSAVKFGLLAKRPKNHKTGNVLPMHGCILVYTLSTHHKNAWAEDWKEKRMRRNTFVLMLFLLLVSIFKIFFFHLFCTREDIYQRMQEEWPVYNMSAYRTAQAPCKLHGKQRDPAAMAQSSPSKKGMCVREREKWGGEDMKRNSKREREKETVCAC